MFWNKGNSDFFTKKDEIEIIIEKHRPLIFGILDNTNEETLCTSFGPVDQRDDD